MAARSGGEEWLRGAAAQRDCEELGVHDGGRPADKVHVVRLLQLGCIGKGRKARETSIIKGKKRKWAFNNFYSNSASIQLKISMLLHMQSILQNN